MNATELEAELAKEKEVLAVLVAHNKQLLAFFDGKPSAKRPFSDALAQSVIAAQAKRIEELEEKVKNCRTHERELQSVIAVSEEERVKLKARVAYLEGRDFPIITPPTESP